MEEASAVRSFPSKSSVEYGLLRKWRGAEPLFCAVFRSFTFNPLATINFAVGFIRRIASISCYTPLADDGLANERKARRAASEDRVVCGDLNRDD